MAKKLEFRCLRPDEIEIRAEVVNEGVKLVLYKSQRTDVSILNETLGEFGWRNSYPAEYNGSACTIEIWDEDKKQWVAKTNFGTPLDFEPVKSLASDAFKRAGYNLGIGIELYTVKNIIAPEKYCNIVANENGCTCSDTFAVENIECDERKIIKLLTIVNETTGKRVFVYDIRDKVVKPGKKKGSSAKAEKLETTVETKGDVSKLESKLESKPESKKVANEEVGKSVLPKKEVQTLESKPFQREVADIKPTIDMSEGRGITLPYGVKPDGSVKLTDLKNAAEGKEEMAEETEVFGEPKESKKEEVATLSTPKAPETEEKTEEKFSDEEWEEFLNTELPITRGDFEGKTVLDILEAAKEKSGKERKVFTWVITKNSIDEKFKRGAKEAIRRFNW